MTTELFPVWLFEHGYTDLISVSPPSAALSPGSKITPSQLGKVPAVRGANGLWRGYDWRRYATEIADVRRWAQYGANIGLRAGRFPAIDVDVTDPELAAEIVRLTLEVLGPAPVRTGRAPKQLLMYRTDVPFARMRLIITAGDGVQYMIEALGEGQQYLVHGIHPITKQPYTWLVTVPPADELTTISPEKVSELFDRIAAVLGPRGFGIEREGEGRIGERAETDQDGLRAPSDDVLQEAVAVIRNTNDLFPRREDYIRFGYAVKAAAHDDDAGLAFFMDWAQRWDGGVNETETVTRDWSRMHPPYSIGWDYIVQLARQFGYSDAADVFGAEPLPPGPTEPGAESQQLRVRFSDRWLADKAVEMIGDRLRYCPALGNWLVWDGVRWRPDDLQRAISEVSDALHQIATDHVSGAIGDGVKQRETEAKRIESTHTLVDVMKVMRANRAIATPVEALDRDPWLLNTPSGIVDLRTGTVGPNRPEELMTKLTLVGPDFTSEAPLWTKFLGEATYGDPELAQYLQRYVGYALTGSVREQVFSFVWGLSGAGKGTFLNAVRLILGTYTVNAPATIFTKGRADNHPTDLASLMGARLITASESEKGKTWDEVRVKSLTGGDPITARKMRQDYFTFEPQGKILIIGNDPPAAQNLDDALRRRMHLVGFWHKANPMDLDLPEKLKAEYPQILAWAIRGALEWQQIGLRPPKSVLDLTAEYFEDEDAVANWIAESIERKAGAQVEAADLFESWKQWCNRNGRKSPGRTQELVRALVEKGFKRGGRGVNGRTVVEGLTLKGEWPVDA